MAKQYLGFGLIFVAALAVTGASAAPSEGFTPHDGFTADGKPQLAGKLDAYLWLPRTDVDADLPLVPNADISIPVSSVLSHLTGAFMGDGIVRYGNWSGEANLFYISVGKTQDVPIPDTSDSLPIRFHSAVFAIAPGVGYRIVKDDQHHVSIDARAGFSYWNLNATAVVNNSGNPGVGRTVDFVFPWIGERLTFDPTPRWRVLNTFALTGLGADGGRMGWNATLGLSYLISKSFDVSLGYRAIQSYKSEPAGPLGEDRSINILDYGPMLAGGWRF